MSTLVKHEYLLKEDYYEMKPVGTRAKSDKYCEHCGEVIKKGTPHEMHHFYPEFNAYPTHNRNNGFNGDRIPDDQKSCSELFIESLN